MCTSIFALALAVVSVTGMAMYGMPAYMGASLVVAAIAIGMTADNMRSTRRTGGK